MVDSRVRRRVDGGPGDRAALMLREETYSSAQGRAGGRLAGALLRT